MLNMYPVIGSLCGYKCAVVNVLLHRGHTLPKHNLTAPSTCIQAHGQRMGVIHQNSTLSYIRLIAREIVTKFGYLADVCALTSTN